MKETEGVLAIIPARSGSKGLPGKNFLTLCGKPLVQWTIEAALDVQNISQVVVSSDSDEVLNLAKSLGAKGHVRSAQLSDDFSKASDVIEDILLSFPNYETLVYLQPTSPLRKSHHVEEALSIFEKSQKIPVVSVVEVTQPPEWMYLMNSEFRLDPYLKSNELRRQDIRKRYIPNGAIYIADTASLKSEEYNFANTAPLPYVMDSRSSIDIDNRFDFDLAEWIMRNSSE